MTATATTPAAPIQVARFQCPHCRRYTRASRARVIEHMACCWRDPAVRGCLTCGNHRGPEEGPYPAHPGFPEDCDAEIDISGGLHTGCPAWTTDTEETPR